MSIQRDTRFSDINLKHCPKRQTSEKVVVLLLVLLYHHQISAKEHVILCAIKLH